MSRKVKILISAIVLALLLTVGATATVLAEGEEETGENSLLGRVAEIIGVDEEELTAAFEQAQQEIREDAFISRINEAVEEERITQEQADDIIEWWLERPDDAFEAWRGQKPSALSPGMFENAPRFRFSFENRRGGCFGWRFCPQLPEETD